MRVICSHQAASLKVPHFIMKTKTKLEIKPDGSEIIHTSSKDSDFTQEDLKKKKMEWQVLLFSLVLLLLFSLVLFMDQSKLKG